MHDDPEGAVLHSDHFGNQGGDADLMQILRGGFLDLGVDLGDDPDDMVAFQGIVNEADGLFAAHDQGHHEVRVEDGVPEGQDGEDVGDGGSFFFSHASPRRV